LFHACLCAAALIFLKRKLLEQNTPEYIQFFLQHPPLTDVTADELERIVHEARRLFSDRKKGGGGMNFDDYVIADEEGGPKIKAKVEVAEASSDVILKVAEENLAVGLESNSHQEIDERPVENVEGKEEAEGPIVSEVSADAESIAIVKQGDEIGDVEKEVKI
jgi:hypothetical protein